MPSTPPRGARSRPEMDYKESDVSKTKRVQDAVKQARKSSRERGPQITHPPRRTPTGLVIATSPERAEYGPSTPRSLGLNSPSVSEIGHMDQLLAPTYDSESRCENGSSVGASSVNTSDDIIRKVEMEIATARKAAAEAQSRLADVLDKRWVLQHKYSVMSEVNHDPLDDLDIPLKDMLSISSGEASPKGAQVVDGAKRKVPTTDLEEYNTDNNDNIVGNDNNDALKTIEAGGTESDEGSHSAKTHLTDPTDSPTGSSSNGSNGLQNLRYTGTQQTIESGVELGLSEVEATLGANGLEAPSDSDGEDYASAAPRSENLPDEFSEYTEETVSDDVSDDGSEYTEETVHSDEESENQPVDRSSQPSKQDESGEDKVAEQVGAPEMTSSKPWIVGSRDMHKSPKEAKPWWSGGWWPDEGSGSAKKEPGQNSERAPNAKGEATQSEELPVIEPAKAESENRSSVGESNNERQGAVSPWSSAPEATNAEHKYTMESSNTKAENQKQEGDKETTSDKAPVFRDLAVNTTDAVPTEETLGQKQEPKNGSSRTQFRQPYPVPPQVPRPRPASDIIADHTTGMPKRVIRWSKPKPELDDLLAAVKGDSLHRRSNAVGALKIMFSKEAKNQIVLVRTTGFLEALVFACGDDILASPDMETAVIARTRAVTTIMKVCEPKENRILVITEPGLPECLVKVIKEDTGEARAHACAALAMLAKTRMNREYLVSIEDLVNTLALVVKGTIDPKMGPALSTEVHIEVKKVATASFSSEDEANDASSAASSTRKQTNIVKNLYKSDSIRKQKDEKKSEFELQAKINACAVLMHLSKHCSVSSVLASNPTFMDSMMAISADFGSPLNTKCVEVLCNITRLHANTAGMARNDMLLETLLKCGKSKGEADRVRALRSFQNMAADPSSKTILANGRILTLLSICAMRKGDEQEAAVATLYNLSTEPSAVVPITNTRNVVATLVHIAHNPKSSPFVRRMSCETLATIGLWLQTLAGFASIPDGVTKTLLPTHTTVGWQRWD